MKGRVRTVKNEPRGQEVAKLYLRPLLMLPVVTAINRFCWKRGRGDRKKGGEVGDS